MKHLEVLNVRLARPNHEISQIFDSTESPETATAILQKENESLTHCGLNERHDPVIASALPDRLWSLFINTALLTSYLLTNTVLTIIIYSSIMTQNINNNKI